MLKRSIFLFLILFLVKTGYSQSADSVYSNYLDFNLARLQGETDKVKTLGQSILLHADKLPEKARINFYFSIGKLYEDNNDHSKALIYYLKVAAAVPNYYVAQRAIGYIYLEDVKALEKKLNESKTNTADNQRLFENYVQATKKALPYLEKAQACDPSDETLAFITNLYKNTKDEVGLESLNSRLKQLAVNCIDILSDQ
jgi:tetratricopeptide (TPR) repeat protein